MLIFSKKEIAQSSTIDIMNMSYVPDKLVVQEALALLVVCLSGPNLPMQSVIRAYLEESKDELFFSSIQKKLRDAIALRREVYAMYNLF